MALTATANEKAEEDIIKQLSLSKVYLLILKRLFIFSLKRLNPRLIEKIFFTMLLFTKHLK